jgi:recombinational DNA repair ATPase RecF
MRLEAATVQRYRNFMDPQRIAVEPDVTCLVGKNEAGKTTILKALHRLKPANGSDVKFDLTTEYPRWRLAGDRRKTQSLPTWNP